MGIEIANNRLIWYKGKKHGFKLDLGTGLLSSKNETKSTYTCGWNLKTTWHKDSSESVNEVPMEKSMEEGFQKLKNTTKRIKLATSSPLVSFVEDESENMRRSKKIK